MFELSDNALNIKREFQNRQPLQFLNQDYRHYALNYSLSTAVTQVAMPIPGKLS